jgi:hypothetical protein
MISSHEISFGYNRNEKGELLKRLTELLEKLREREQSKPGEKARPKPRVTA